MSIQEAPESPRVPIDSFGVRLRVARFHAGDISIERASELCGVKPATWSTWERNLHRPPHFDAMVKALAGGLGVDEAWLRDGGPLTPEPPTSRDGKPVTLSKKPSRRSVRKAATRRNSVYNVATLGVMAA